MPTPPTKTTIEISKDYLHFSAAHFTIFSATQRENLHGHNFYVTAEVSSEIGDDGLAFDYNLVKEAMKQLCDSLDEKVLLPEQSPHLKLNQEAEYLVAEFARERIPFLPRDVLAMPLRNITVEELASWFLSSLRRHNNIKALVIETMVVRVSSGPGQWAAAHWPTQK